MTEFYPGEDAEQVFNLSDAPKNVPSEADALAYHYPVVSISLKGGLLSVDHKTEGCIVFIRDYDAMDPEQGAEGMWDRRATCDIRVDDEDEEYQLIMWGIEKEV